MGRNGKMGRLGPISLALTMIAACVTINIYFPAEKVESVATEIVEDIRGQAPTKEDNPQSSPSEKNSSMMPSLWASWFPLAWAEEVTTVSNPTIRALKERMKARFAQMKPSYQKGMLVEGDDGYVALGPTSELDLRALRNLKGLVSAENKDRQDLYREVARALDIEVSQTGRVAEIFAKEWQKSVR